MTEPRFLNIEEVLYLHELSIARFGGAAGVGSLGQVESALGAAKNIYYYANGDLYAIAAGYAFHIAEAQAFIDGNKRTAVAAAIAFLAVNAIEFPQDDGSLYKAMIAIANKQLDKPGLAVVLRKLVENKT